MRPALRLSIAAACVVALAGSAHAAPRLKLGVMTSPTSATFPASVQAVSDAWNSIASGCNVSLNQVAGDSCSFSVYTAQVSERRDPGKNYLITAKTFLAGVAVATESGVTVIATSAVVKHEATAGAPRKYSPGLPEGHPETQAASVEQEFPRFVELLDKALVKMKKKGSLQVASPTGGFAPPPVVRVLDAPDPAAAPAPAVAEPTGPAALPPSVRMTTTPSGLSYADLVEGTGPSPSPGQTVVVHYVGWLQSGQTFDSSRARGQPLEFAIGSGRLIAGWEEGILTMKVGGTRRLVIPPGLAYGEQGVPSTIPPGATLTFDIELLEVR